MPDVREVYEMVTKQKPAPPGGLERQRTKQLRVARNRKVGAILVVAAVTAAAAIAGVLSLREPARDRTGGVRTIQEPALTLPGVGGGFSDDGAHVFVEAPDSPRGLVYDATTGALIRTLSGPAGDLLLDISPDGDHFLVAHRGGTSDASMDVYETETGDLVHRFEGACCFGVFGPDGRIVALPGRGGTRVYRLDGTVVQGAEAPSGLLAFSPDGDRLAIAPCCGSEQDGISLYIGHVREEGWGEYLTIQGETPDFVAWSHDGASIGAVSEGSLRVWDATSGRPAFVVPDTSHATARGLTTVRFGPGSLAATGTIDGRVVVWRTTDEGATAILSVRHGAFPVSEVWLDPTGGRLMTTDGASTKIWDLAV
jgi:WD40 repeat protein